MDRSAQVIDRSLPLLDLTSLALILQGLKARSKEGERVGESMLGSSFLRWEQVELCWVMVRSGGEKNIYSVVQNDYRYYRWGPTGTTGPPDLAVGATQKSCEKMTYRYYRFSTSTTGLDRYTARTPVLPVVHFSATPRARSPAAQQTGTTS
jgi:hypothetical protein